MVDDMREESEEGMLPELFDSKVPQAFPELSELMSFDFLLPHVLPQKEEPEAPPEEQG